MRARHLFVATLCFGLLSIASCSRPEPAAEPVRAVKSIVVAADQVDATIVYAAEIKPQTESRLSFRVAGKLSQRSADLGDRVRAGQTLARLDARDLELAQRAAQAALAAARAAFDQARADHERARELKEQGFIGSAEFERRTTSMRSAQAQFRQAQAQAAVQSNQAGYAELVSDVDGIVTGVDAEPGMVLAAGTPVLRIARDGPRDVVFAVPENKVDLVRRVGATPGAVQVVLWGEPGKPHPVTVREIAAAADPVTRTFQVRAGLDAPTSAAVRLGQTASVRLDLPAGEAAVKLPLSALKEQGGRSIAWVVDPARLVVRARPVVPGTIDGNQVVIDSGLAAGERVVTAGVHLLHDGQQVRLYSEPSAAAPGLQPASAAAAPATPASRTAQ